MDIRFVYEDPDSDRNRRKRPRMTTSCDRCRLRKTRCIRPNLEASCEACVEAKVPCLSTDIERYQVEMAAILAQQTSSLRASPDEGAIVESSSDPLLNLTPVETLYSGPVAAAPRPHVGEGSGVRSTGSDRQEPAEGQSQETALELPFLPLPLFDPNMPSYPHPSLMPHAIQRFFAHYSWLFSFLDEAGMVLAHLEGRLDASIACAVAALSTPFINDVAEFRGHNPVIASQAYSAQAKNLLASAINEDQARGNDLRTGLSVVHAIILVAWIERSSGNLSGFANYAQLARNMAAHIGIDDNVRMAQLPVEDAPWAERIAATWICLNGRMRLPRGGQ